jgi:hypothetical protein
MNEVNSVKLEEVELPHVPGLCLLMCQMYYQCKNTLKHSSTLNIVLDTM